MPHDLRLFTCLKDNYGVLLHDPATGATAAIDAPEAGPVERALGEAGWRLTDILVTHHHHDHVGGVEALKARFGAKVTAPAREAARIPGVDRTVAEGDAVRVGDLAATVIETPGHTAGHVSYHFADEKLLFAGDTLFAIGCGRLLEGSPGDMWASLQRLAALPGDTEVYCGHEYTLSNARFALSVDSGNSALVERAREVESLRAANRPTLPTTIARERATNPFLRAADTGLARAVGMAGGTPLAVFAEVRARKDRA